MSSLLHFRRRFIGAVNVVVIASLLLNFQTIAFVISKPTSKLPITVPFYRCEEHIQYGVLLSYKHPITSYTMRSKIQMNKDSSDDAGGVPSMRSWRRTHFSMTILFTILFTWISMTCNSTVANANSNNGVIYETNSPMTTSSIQTRSKSNNAYWNTLNNPISSISDIQTINEKLFDQVVGNINTLYYDNSGGASFYPKDFYDRWKVLKAYSYRGIEGVSELAMNGPSYRMKVKTAAPVSNVQGGDDYIPQLFWIDRDHYSNRPILKMQKGHLKSQSISTPIWTLPRGEDGSSVFDSRENTVKGIKWLVSTLEDPYSKYLTREELEKELLVRDDGFLGLGAIVEIAPAVSALPYTNISESRSMGNLLSLPTSRWHVLSLSAVKNLPQITAIAPDSPAERAGLVVGDRVVAVGADKFLGLARDQVIRRLSTYTGADNYFGYPELTIAKPVELVKHNFNLNTDVEELIGYKMSKVRLRTTSLDQFKLHQISLSEAHSSFLSSGIDDIQMLGSDDVISGGDSIVHWQMLTSKASIFSKLYTFSGDEINQSLGSSYSTISSTSSLEKKVGYIRLTRFSRSSSAGFVKAVNDLEKSGAQAYIIDLRNNYGGVIQEAMLTASSLLRDPHSVLCYTINSRGGFTPHDVEEYVIDKRYPGYLLSSESKDVAINQAKRDDPEFFSGDGWTPPSAFASLHEQRQHRHIAPPSTIRDHIPLSVSWNENRRSLNAQKKIVILQNEGTASAAEVFVSSLKDNGRLVGTVGSKTYGKGLIQHTLPLPDGGGLRLTVAEYLTPSLQHVTKIGRAQYDQITGEYIGGGLRPDVQCDTRGIPSNVGADLCVGVALDMLEDAGIIEQ